MAADSGFGENRLTAAAAKESVGLTLGRFLGYPILSGVRVENRIDMRDETAGGKTVAKFIALLHLP